MRILPYLGLGLVLAASHAHARDHFPTQIPNGAVQSCTTCHSADPPAEANLNLFGDQVHGSGLDNGHQNVVWANVFALDADGDGCTNGYELGDPDGIWTPGAAAGPVQGAPSVAGDCTPPGDGDGDGDGDADAGDPPQADGGPTGDGDGDSSGDGDGDGDGDTAGGCNDQTAGAGSPRSAAGAALALGLVGWRLRRRRAR